MWKTLTFFIIIDHLMCKIKSFLLHLQWKYHKNISRFIIFPIYFIYLNYLHGYVRRRDTVAWCDVVLSVGAPHNQPSDRRNSNPHDLEQTVHIYVLTAFNRERKCENSFCAKINRCKIYSIKFFFQVYSILFHSWYSHLSTFHCWYNLVYRYMPSFVLKFA